MWDTRITTEMGRRIHRLVGAAVVYDVGIRDVPGLVADLFAAEPLGGSVSAGLRTRCVSAVSRYLVLFRPSGWVLVGIEERLPACRADLVWLRPDDRALVIEELKSERTTMAAPDTARQVRALHDAGAVLWPERFAGVRVSILSSPDRSWMVTGSRGGTKRSSWPAGMRPFGA